MALRIQVSSCCLWMLYLAICCWYCSLVGCVFLHETSHSLLLYLCYWMFFLLPIHRRENENEARISRRPAGKSFFQKPDAKPRAALGSIANTFLERNAPGKVRYFGYLILFCFPWRGLPHWWPTKGPWGGRTIWTLGPPEPIAYKFLLFEWS